MLEDLLRMCVPEFGGSWEDHIPLVEFAYNNSFNLVLEWPHSKHYMVDRVDLRYVG